jgi:alanine racemase
MSVEELALQRAVAVVDQGAVERNCARLLDELGGSELCAVVKANGYGHGAVDCARAALAGGATWLAVAAAAEAAELRSQLPDARLLTMGALTEAELDLALEADSDVAVWRGGFAGLAAERGAELGVRPRLHVKYDTGMGRLGERDPDAVLALVDAVAADERLDLVGLWTHFATADEPESGFFGEQLERFAQLAERARAEHPRLLLHAANSAAALRDPASHFDMARCGIAIYGLDPFHSDPFASPRSSCAPTSPTRSASRPGQAPGTDSAGGRPPTPGSGCCPSATGTASAAGSQTTARRWWAAPGMRSSAPSPWTTSPWTSALPRRWSPARPRC